MCGRFAQYTTPDVLAQHLDAILAGDVGAGWQPRWNVGPTSAVLGLSAVPSPRAGTAGARVLGTYRWGLVPATRGAAGPTASRLFNARAETVATKPTFRAAFPAHRAVVPVDGFYEWHRGPGSRRQAHYFRRRDGAPTLLGALWEPRPGPAPDGATAPEAWQRSCTILTTGAGADMDGIHPRMPVVVEPQLLDEWLDPSAADRSALEALLRPARGGTLVHHPVGPRVGNVRNDGPDLIDPDRRTPSPELPYGTTPG